MLRVSAASIERVESVCREEVSAQQLRDDLLSMLVAGHETTASALTWTMKLLAENPEKLSIVRPEIPETPDIRSNGVLSERHPDYSYGVTSQSGCESLMEP